MCYSSESLHIRAILNELLPRKLQHSYIKGKSNEATVHEVVGRLNGTFNYFFGETIQKAQINIGCEVPPPTVQ